MMNFSPETVPNLNLNMSLDTFTFLNYPTLNEGSQHRN